MLLRVRNLAGIDVGRKTPTATPQYRCLLRSLNTVDMRSLANRDLAGPGGARFRSPNIPPDCAAVPSSAVRAS